MFRNGESDVVQPAANNIATARTIPGLGSGLIGALQVIQEFIQQKVKLSAIEAAWSSFVLPENVNRCYFEGSVDDRSNG